MPQSSIIATRGCIKGDGFAIASMLGIPSFYFNYLFLPTLSL